MLAIDYNNWFGRIGGFLFVLGFVVLAAPVPWDLGPCPAYQTEYQQTEYRQTFQHDVENVSQIPRLGVVRSGRIRDMGMTKISRAEFWKGMGSLWIFKVVAMIWALFGLFSAFIPFFPQTSEKFYSLSYFPKLHWYVWIIGILVIALIATFEGGYKQVRELKVQLAARVNTRVILDTLGRFIGEGQELISLIYESQKPKLENQPDPPPIPENEANEWANRVETFLQEHFGEGYVHRFRSHAGLPLGSTRLFGGLPVRLESGIKTRIARLEQFSQEIAAKIS
jgi:hypothetical protein